MHDGRQLSLTWALLVMADGVWCRKRDWVISWRDLSFPIDKWWLYFLWTVTYPEEDLKAKQFTWVSCVTHWFAGREKQSRYFLIFQVWMEGYCLPPTAELLITVLQRRWVLSQVIKALMWAWICALMSLQSDNLEAALSRIPGPNSSQHLSLGEICCAIDL